MDDRADVQLYDDGNRAFLQALMARGSLTLREAQPIIASILTIASQQRDPEAEATPPGEITQEHLQSFIATAAEALSHFDYDIRSTMHQSRRERVWALVNVASDPLTQMATLHSAEEIAFVKRVLDAMFEKYNTPRMEVMCLDSMQANKLARAPVPQSQRIPEEGDEDEESEMPPRTQSQLKGLKSSEAEAMMNAMVEEGWFEKSAEGLYSLTPRALLELRSWLVDSYNDPDAEPDEWQRVKFCLACKEIVTVGQRCADRDCNVRVHEICQEAFWRTRRDKNCPKCGLEWSGKHFVGEKAVTETEAYQRGRRRGGRGRSSNFMEQIMQDPAEDELDGV